MEKVGSSAIPIKIYFDSILIEYQHQKIPDVFELVFSKELI
jgi:hypothetical protein